MQRYLYLLAGLFFVAVTSYAAEKDVGSDGIAALEAKLIATWYGQGPCTGTFVFRADRTYERLHHGPGGNNSAGTWELRRDALPPALHPELQQVARQSSSWVA